MTHVTLQATTDRSKFITMINNKCRACGYSFKSIDRGLGRLFMMEHFKDEHPMRATSLIRWMRSHGKAHTPNPHL